MSVLIPNKIKVNFVVAVIACVFVWFVLPHIKMGDSYPFATIQARMVITAIILGLYLLVMLIEFCIKNKEKTLKVISEKISNIWISVKLSFKKIWQLTSANVKDLRCKITQDRKQRRLDKLPWYLVLGNPEAGKKHIIKNTGLYFAKAEHFCDEAVNYVNQFPDFDWWFSEQAVMIDSMTYDKEKDNANWLRFLKVLRKHRKQKPLNGIVLSFSLPELMLYSNKNRQEFLQDICQYIRDIHASFKSMVPVYIIFNKCDLIEGFLSFFNDLSKEELRQVWGMTLPVEHCHQSDFVSQFFNYEYNKLIEHLHNRVMWGFDSERTSRGRELIHEFPQQMQLLKKPIESFIAELFGATRYTKALQVRGIYFTSCDQVNGDSFDLVLHAMSKKFQLVPPRFERQKKLSECYFMRNIFFDIIYPERAILGDSEKTKRNKRIIYNFSLISCPMILLLLIVGMHKGYVENTHNIKLVNNKLDYYDKSKGLINIADDAIETTLPSLDKLYQATQIYNKDNQQSLRFIFTSKYIKYQINNMMSRALHEQFLPRVASNLQDGLEANIQDPNLLYATLKGYLAFSNTSKVNANAVKTPMQYQWQYDYLDNDKLKKRLNTYLELALATTTDKLPLDNTLINRRREELEQIVPSERAYGLLSVKASVSNVPSLAFNSAIGGSFNKIFSVKNNVEIPGVYTRTGFENVYEKQYKTISKAVADDNKDIGLVNDSDTTQTESQIIELVQKTYNKNYIYSWNSALHNIQVKPFSSMKQAIDDLDILINKNSPLPKLLNVIYDNSAQIQADNISVSDYFSKINTYTKEQKGEESLVSTIKGLTDLRDYMVKLQQAANQNKACFDAAVSAMQGTQSPIQKLSLIAAKAPYPVNSWLNTIADNAWEIIVKGAHAQMNAAWQAEVMNDYNVSINDRYPLNKKADSEIAIEDFDNFFSSQGTLNNYFNKYIKPFVNIDENKWTEYTVDNHSIELSDDTLQLFERASLIRKSYFDQKTNKATFEFRVKPLVLDEKAGSISLTMGPEHIVYSHGPQPSRVVDWPMPFNQEDASIIINDFDGNQHARSATGPWSIFKILDDGSLKQAAHSGTYYYIVNLGGYHATYQITGNGSLGTFRLSLLTGFTLPKQIAPDRG